MSQNKNNCYIEQISTRENTHSGPLTGKRFSIKDCFWFNGRQPTLGISRELLNKSDPKKNPPLISQLIELGATPIAFSNMYPLAAGITNENPWYGDVISETHHVLGSTSGGALSVLNNETDFCLGSDSGGSIRAPAASCGLTGISSQLLSFSREGMVHHGEEIDGPGFITKNLASMYELLNSLQMTLDDGNEGEVIFLSPEDISLCDAETIERYNSIVNNFSADSERKVRCASLFNYFKEAYTVRKDLAALGIQRIIQTNITSPELLPKDLQAICKLSISKDAANDALLKFREKFLKEIGKDFCIITPTLPRTVNTREQQTSSELNIFLPLANVLLTHALSFPSQYYPSFSLQIITNYSVNSLFSTAQKL